MHDGDFFESFDVPALQASRMGLATAICLLLLAASCWPGLDRQPRGARGVRNPSPEDGQQSSVRLGLESASVETRPCFPRPI